VAAPGAKPPTPLARLELFCDLAEEYDAMAAAHPVEDMSIHLGGPSRPVDEQHNLLIRAVGLRKFALDENDQVFLTKVFHSANACLARYDRGSRRGVGALLHRFASIGTALRVNEGAEGPTTITAVVLDRLYGSVLHGDYERHQRARARADLTHDVAMTMFVSDAESLVRLTIRLTRNGIADGTLALR